MIKVKITGKVGTSLQRELPTDIHQLYHDMREAGINKPPRNILLHDDNAVTVPVISALGEKIKDIYWRSSCQTM